MEQIDNPLYLELVYSNLKADIHAPTYNTEQNTD